MSHPWLPTDCKTHHHHHHRLPGPLPSPFSSSVACLQSKPPYLFRARRALPIDSHFALVQISSFAIFTCTFAHKLIILAMKSSLRLSDVLTKPLRGRNAGSVVAPTFAPCMLGSAGHQKEQRHREVIEPHQFFDIIGIDHIFRTAHTSTLHCLLQCGTGHWLKAFQYWALPELPVVSISINCTALAKCSLYTQANPPLRQTHGVIPYGITLSPSMLSFMWQKDTYAVALFVARALGFMGVADI